ncbi:hypothetical protein OGM63_02425 [Plectonema radiosum NIES-515]|uniref:Uncharacterized protein n=1 Tax=Plectonema radiosum NIES-515 TaxID=2986073 RepID=A0ABT3ATE7_9CYAN|nr:hypothetical protein [Plectonema radiosum]MCV3212396.1 hypothetical protein [Plectonema radiosum NIES-515]
MKRGYTVRIFAPGFPESETCNPLDLLRDEEDAIALLTTYASYFAQLRPWWK